MFIEMKEPDRTSIKDMMALTDTDSPEALQQLLKKRYYEGNPIVTDAEYDALFPVDPIGYELDDNTIWPKWSHTVESVPMSKFKKVNDANAYIDLSGTKPSVIEHKLDGINLTLYYTSGKLMHAVTRGSGIEGEDILPNALSFKGVPSVIDSPKLKNIVVRGELVMSADSFDQISEFYANRRNATAGIARRLDGEYSELLSFYAYKIYVGLEENSPTTELTTTEARRLLTALGFIVPENLINTGDSLKTIYNQCADNRDTYSKYPHDGLVIKSDKYEFALKYQANTEVTTITKYEWNLGNTNRLIPVVHFEPVVIGGATLTKASVASANKFREFDAPVGSLVEIARANEVIPYLKKIVKRADGPIEIPTKCPACGKSLDWEGAHLVCNNPACSNRLRSHCERIVRQLEVPRFTIETVDKLIENGTVTKATDLFNLTPADLIAINMSDKVALKMLQGIKNSLSQFTDCDIVFSLNLPKISFNAIVDLEDEAIAAGSTLLDVIDQHNYWIIERVLKPQKTNILRKYLEDTTQYEEIKAAIKAKRNQP